jgi:hypothetical protein
LAPGDIAESLVRLLKALAELQREQAERIGKVARAVAELERAAEARRVGR